METMEAEELLSELNHLLDEASGSEEPTPPPATSLCSATFASMFDLKMVPKLLSALSLEEDEASCIAGGEDGGMKGKADPGEEAALNASFQSKFVTVFPLYQDYCLQVDQEELTVSRVTGLLASSRPQTLLSPEWCPEARVLPLSSSQTTTAAAAPHRPIQKATLSSCWRDLDEVKESGLLGTMTTREIRLQESMFELVGSEASYLRSLGVAVNHFYASGALRRTLSRVEHHGLFSNIQGVMAASERFLMDLEERLERSVMIPQVGDVVLRHCPAFHRLYVPYVTNMMYQEALVDQLLEQNRAFSSLVRRLESDPVCQRQSLKSFLVLPFQRITRMKLILQNILKLTEPGSDTIVNLEGAIEAIHEVVVSCDGRVRRMRQIEELICLDALIDFGKIKAVPLVVGGRFLVHQGPVRQLCVESSSRVSEADIYLHLFSDLLIISTKRDRRFAVVDHAAFPAHVHVEPLKPQSLGLPADSFLLHLSQSQTGHPTAMILVALTRSHKEMWITALSNKVKET